MKYRRKTIIRALESAQRKIDRKYSEEDFLSGKVTDEHYKQEIAREFVRIMMLRSHHLFDCFEQQELYEVALNILC